MFKGSQDFRGDKKSTPLAARCRPERIEELVGHQKWLGPLSPLARWLQSGNIPSIVVWGPPGTGKTSFARSLAQRLSFDFIEMSGPQTTVTELKKVIADAKAKLPDKRTLLFLDEVHRLTRVQQDSVLAAVEEGSITLVGVTTENPKHSVSPAILSRSQVLAFEALKNDDLVAILRRGLEIDGHSVGSAPGLAGIAKAAGGDARRALNLLEMIVGSHGVEIVEDAQRTHAILVALESTSAYLSLDEESHYQLTSDYIKAMRRGDEVVAIERLAQLLSHGEDPAFIARRLVIFAAEDVGLASPQFLSFASAVYDTVERIGMPEAKIPLSAGTLAGCRARKSREAYEVIQAAMDKVSSS